MEGHVHVDGSADARPTVPLAADQKDSKEVVVIISVVSAQITYTYHRSGVYPVPLPLVPGL